MIRIICTIFISVFLITSAEPFITNVYATTYGRWITDDSIYSDSDIDTTADLDEPDEKHNVFDKLTGYYMLLNYQYMCFKYNLSDTLNTMSISDIILGRVVTGNTNDIWHFSLAKGNTYGKYSAFIYSLIRSIMLGFFAVYFFFILFKQSMGTNTGNSIREFKDDLQSFILMFLLLFVMPNFVDLIIYCRDSLLNLMCDTLLSKTTGSNSQLTNIFYQNLVNDPCTINGVLLYASFFLSIYFAFIYISVAYTMTIMFALFPLVVLLSIRNQGKALLTNWFKLFIGSAAIPVIDFLLVSIALSIPSTSEFLRIIACWCIIPCRGFVRSMLGSEQGRKAEMFGVGTMAGALMLGKMALSAAAGIPPLGVSAKSDDAKAAELDEIADAEEGISGNTTAISNPTDKLKTLSDPNEEMDDNDIPISKMQQLGNTKNPELDNDDTLPKGSDTPINNDNTLLKGSDTPINNDNTLPNDSDAPINNDNTLLKGSDTPINNDNTLPNDSDAPINNDNTLPKGSNTPINNGNTLPDGSDTPANNGNTLPDGSDTPANNGNTLPDGSDTPANNGNTLPDGSDTDEDDEENEITDSVETLKERFRSNSHGNIPKNRVENLVKMEQAAKSISDLKSQGSKVTQENAALQSDINTIRADAQNKLNDINNDIADLNIQKSQFRPSSDEAMELNEKIAKKQKEKAVVTSIRDNNIAAQQSKIQGNNEALQMINGEISAYQNDLNDAKITEANYAMQSASQGGKATQYNSPEAYVQDTAKQQRIMEIKRKYVNASNFESPEYSGVLSNREMANMYRQRAIQTRSTEFGKIAGTIVVGGAAATAATFFGPGTMATAGVAGSMVGSKIGSTIGSVTNTPSTYKINRSPVSDNGFDGNMGKSYIPTYTNSATYEGQNFKKTDNIDWNGLFENTPPTPSTPPTPPKAEYQSLFDNIPTGNDVKPSIRNEMDRKLDIGMQSMLDYIEQSKFFANGGTTGLDSVYDPRYESEIKGCVIKMATVFHEKGFNKIDNTKILDLVKDKISKEYPDVYDSIDWNSISF